MPELVRIIRALSSDEGSISISDMADMINQDQSILLRVVAAANTFGYNPSGAEITSVTEAIHTIGFNRVRTLAMSLMLLDHAERSTSPTEQRQMSTLSLCSGMVAQVVAERSPLMSPELAFVCAALRNFGRLLLGTFMTDDFRSARDAAEAGAGDIAYRKAFGLTPLELGYELLKSANLPKPILNAVRQHELPDDEAAWTDRKMQRLAAVALEISEVTLDASLDARKFEDARDKIMAKAAADFPHFAHELTDILATASERLTRLVSAHAATARNLAPGLNRLRDRVHSLTKAAAEPSPAATSSSTPPPASPHHAEPLAATPFASVTAGQHVDDATVRPTPPSSAPSIAERDLLAESPTPASSAPDSAPAARLTPEPVSADILKRMEESGCPDETLQLALDTVWQSLAPRDLIYAQPDSRGRTFTIHRGRGPLSDELGHRTLFSANERNAFLLCHQHLRNLAVKDTAEPKINPLLPPWLKSDNAPRSFLALPVAHRRELKGILLIGWENARRQPFGPNELAPIQRLFELVARVASQAALV